MTIRGFRICVTVLAAFSAFSSNAAANTWKWAKQMVPTGNDFSPENNALAITAAPDGRLYFVGHFSDRIEFQGIRLVTAGEFSAPKSGFLACMTQDGDILWAIDTGGDECVGVCIGENGNVFVIGEFSGRTTFASGNSYTSQGLTDIFLGEATPSGEWVKESVYGGNGRDIVTDIACDRAGGFLVSGAYEGTTEFGGLALQSSGDRSGFLLGLSGDGALIWAREIDSSIDVVPTGLTVPESGASAYCIGFFRGQAFLEGGASLTSTPNTDGNASYDSFLLTFNKTAPEGEDIVSAAGTENDDFANAIDLFDDGAIAIGGATQTGEGSDSEMFLMRTTADGIVDWFWNGGGRASGYLLPDSINSISISDRQTVVATGIFSAIVEIGNYRLSSIRDFETDLFVAEFSGAGEPLWALDAGYGEQPPSDIVAVGDNAFLCGGFHFTLQFGEHVIDGDFADRIFVAGLEIVEDTIEDRIANAVDAPGYQWMTRGDELWVVDQDVWSFGGSSVRTGEGLSANEVSWLRLDIAGPGGGSFRWRASTIGNFEFYLNGVRRGRLGGEEDWSQVEFNLVDGTNTLEWRYAESRLGPLNFVDNAGWVDLFQIQTVPGNDNFQDALPIVAGSGTGFIDTRLATIELTEPFHAGDIGGASVWYSWVADGEATVLATTEGSDYDTLVAVYRGESLESLVEIGSNDDAPGEGFGSFSEVRFLAEPGLQYFIAIDGWSGATGLATLSITRNLLSEILSIVQQGAVGDGIEVSFVARNGFTYALEFSSSARRDAEWTVVRTISGDGSVVELEEQIEEGDVSRFYRIRIVPTQ